jgi:hypothetical protein
VNEVLSFLLNFLWSAAAAAAAELDAVTVTIKLDLTCEILLLATS